MVACLGEACLDDGALVAQPLFRAAERSASTVRSEQHRLPNSTRLR